MKVRELESELSSLQGFQRPKVHLEQYPTQPHLASRVVYTAATSFDDVDGKVVLDLGCGCGVLGIGAVMMGADQVVGVDVDEDALDVAQANVDELEMAEAVELVRADVASLVVRPGVVDTVITNPPFGTRNKGIDSRFVEVALSTGASAVYSLHKTTTRQHFERKAKQWGVEVEVVAELRFDVPALYSFHKKKSKDIAVDLLRFSRP